MMAKQDLLVGSAVMVAAFGIGFAVAKGRAKGNAMEEMGAGASKADRPLTAMMRSRGRMSADFSKLVRDREICGYQKLRALMALVEAAEVEDIPALMGQVTRELHGRPGRGLLVEMLAARWAAKDPMGALEATLTKQPIEMEEHGGAVIRELAESDKVEHWNLLREHCFNTDGEKYLESYLTGIAKWDLDLALARAAELDPLAFRAAVSPFLRELAKTEPGRVLEFVRTCPGVLGQRKNVEYVYDEEKEPLISSGLGSLELEPYGEVAAILMREEPARAVEWVEGLDEREREAAMPALLKGWAQGETMAAVDYAFEKASQSTQENLFDDLLALEYGRGLSFEQKLRMANVGEGKTRGRSKFVGGWLWEGDLAAAVEWTAGRPSSERREIMKGAADWWYDLDEKAAMMKVAQIPDPEFKRIAIEAMAKAVLPELDSGDVKMAPELRTAAEALKAEQQNAADGGGATE